MKGRTTHIYNTILLSAYCPSTLYMRMVPSHDLYLSIALVNLYRAKILKGIRVRSRLMSDQLKAVLNRCIFSSVLKLVRDEADCTLLGRVP